MFGECDANFNESNTNKDCIPMTFRDIAQNGIEKQCDFVICSYEIYLFKKSVLPMLLYRICKVSNNLIIPTPHKKQNCNGEFFKEIKRLKQGRTSIIWYKNNMVNESFCFM